MIRDVEILCDEVCLARVRRGGDRGYRLSYTASWCALPGAFAISASLPLTPRTHRGDVVHNFLDNLLPDHPRVRRRWAREAGVAPGDLLGLLARYGDDVAGAIRFREIGVVEPEREPVVLSEADLAARIRMIRGDASRWRGTAAHSRFSLGGAQGKFTLARHSDGSWREPTAQHPSTHIFKPRVAGIADGEIVEFLIMRLAARLGLPAAIVELARYEEEHTLLIQRFDRLPGPGGTILRQHQEDGAQLLGVSGLRKYQRLGGPGYQDVLGALTHLPGATAESARASCRRYLEYLLFSWLVLNTDAHVKNYSVCYSSEGPVLAPLYDASSFLPYLDLGEEGELCAAIARTELAMTLVDSYRVGDMARFQWWGAAREAGVARTEFLHWARHLCTRIPGALEAVVGELDPRFHVPALQRLRSRLPMRAAQAGAALAP